MVRIRSRKADGALTKAVEPYRAGKGTLRFPLDGTVPRALITKVVEQLKKESEERMLARQGKAKG